MTEEPIPQVLATLGVLLGMILWTSAWPGLSEDPSPHPPGGVLRFCAQTLDSTFLWLCALWDESLSVLASLKSEDVPIRHRHWLWASRDPAASTTFVAHLPGSQAGLAG